MWLTLAGEVEGAGRDEDALAYHRDAHQFHNVLLVERANGNYADTMARQFLFDVWHYFLLQRLEQSSDERVAGIAAKSIKEVTYHVRRRHRRRLALHRRTIRRRRRGSGRGCSRHRL
ncbi:hypothetical protein G6F59_017637 [Rhizopus arrhizus]|nr:hypothetical protein G6F59_017637 [Rhizopus arrhizus]